MYFLTRMLFNIIVALSIVLSIFLLNSCSSANGETNNYQSLYNEQLSINSKLKLENDSLLIVVHYLDSLIVKLNVTIKDIRDESIAKIDLLESMLATRDSDTVILLRNIESGLENLSDTSLEYLRDIRNK